MEVFIVRLHLSINRFVDPGQDITVLGKVDSHCQVWDGLPQDARWRFFPLWEFAAQLQIKGNMGGGVKRSKGVQEEARQLHDC